MVPFLVSLFAPDGGQGDKKHLGGFTEIDLFGISPAVWKSMISYLGSRRC
jgi:hypothetical protein